MVRPIRIRHGISSLAIEGAMYPKAAPMTGGTSHHADRPGSVERIARRDRHRTPSPSHQLISRESIVPPPPFVSALRHRRALSRSAPRSARAGPVAPHPPASGPRPARPARRGGPAFPRGAAGDTVRTTMRSASRRARGRASRHLPEPDHPHPARAGGPSRAAVGAAPAAAAPSSVPPPIPGGAA